MTTRIGGWLAAIVAAGTFLAGAAQAQPYALTSRKGMVVSSQHLASDVGAQILREGGNAIDAAVAVGYALAVTHPCCGNIGGGGFMMVHRAGAGDIFIDFREMAPHRAGADMYLGPDGKPVPERSLDGWLAVGTPGTVLGLEEARVRYGTMSRARLMAPAIRLAWEGFVLDPGDVEVLTGSTEKLRVDPNVAAIFLKEGRPFKPGERLVQRDLAVTLQAISDRGPAAFYQGRLPSEVATASGAGGGVISAADFAAYRTGTGAPIRCDYRGYQIVSAPPPSSGGVTLCEMLEILSAYPMKSYGFHSAQSAHLMTEAMRRAYRDRNAFLGDPAFVDNQTGHLLSAAHVASLRASISNDRATRSSALPGIAGAPENATTTHYSVVDARGNAVAVTYTLNDDFGAKVIAGGTGVLMNDEMDDFTAKPGYPNVFGLIQGKANAIAPGKRPLSSMTPTFVEKDGKVVLVVGTPGGSRIITTVLEVIVDVLDYRMDLKSAVDAPRFHNQWLPDTLAAEPGALSPATQARLTAMGYDVTALEPWGSGNSAEVIGVAPADATAARRLGFAKPGLIYGAADRRAPAGSAAAP
ncbi:MAG TPA: gamma-glutamyltransferase [Caulobacteraceae bacterium]|jgi:gamma-glutamyltranspeptidase/glutathione hydrolase|nr:gamma-glutamyltransferase [Caulobacteraceae bacterium]